MISEIVFLKGAEEDLLNAFVFFDERGKGEEFDQEIEAKLLLLKAYPEMGSFFRKPYRRLLLKRRFAHGIFYNVQGHRLIVVAVLDLRLHPSKILDRLGGP